MIRAAFSLRLSPMRAICLLGFSLVLLAGWPAVAQQADPFGGGQDPFSQPAAAPAAEAAPAAAAPPAATTPEARESDPIVLAVRDSNPDSPAELIRAIQTMLNIRRFDEADRYAQELLAQNPDANALADLHQRFGSSLFLRMATERELSAEGKQLALDVLEAAQQRLTSPEHLAQVIQNLSSPDAGLRRAAVVDLRQAADAGLIALVDALGRSDDAAQVRAIQRALLEMGPRAVDPLLAALRAPDLTLRTRVIEVLGHSRASLVPLHLLRGALSANSETSERAAAEQALTRLTGGIPKIQQAERLLAHYVRRYLEGGMVLTADEQGLVPLWLWSDEEGQLRIQRYLPEDAASLLAANLAADLYAIQSNAPEYRTLYLVTLLHSAQLLSGFDQPLPAGEGTARELARSAGPAVIEEVLAFALEHQLTAAAIAAAEVLGEIGDATLLSAPHGQPRPLAQALQQGDRRLRMTAAASIMRLNPQSPYPGSSVLVDLLGYVVRTTGARQALVADPRVVESQRVLGLLNSMGIEAESAATGERAFAQAVELPDLEFLLVSDSIERPELRQLIETLRQDRRTASLPIGILATVDQLERRQRLAEEIPGVVAFPVPAAAEQMQDLMQRLLRWAPRQQVTPEERMEHAAVALEWLAQLAESEDTYKFYNVVSQQDSVRQALDHPALSQAAARVLGRLGTPTAQKALVDLASQPSRPLADRQAAADAFTTAVERRGLLLTEGEILLQYDRYNASAQLDVNTQQVLSQILDTIEAPTQAVAAEQS